MKIGLLQCEHMDTLDFEADYADMFVQLFNEYAPSITLKTYDVVNGDYPTSIDECDGYIISGSLYSVYDNEQWIQNLTAYVQQLYAAQRPTVGICFGHQMLAHALGGEVKKSERGYGLGIAKVKVNTPQSWMQPDLSSYSLSYLHQDQVESLPKNGTIIGGNDHCPIAVFTIGDHILGIQGHPEFTTKFINDMINAHPEIFDADTIESAKQTLHKSTDEGSIATWIHSFFTNQTVGAQHDVPDKKANSS